MCIRGQMQRLREHPERIFFSLSKGVVGEWGILTPYPEAEWVFSPESIMPPRPIERSSRAEGA